MIPNYQINRSTALRIRKATYRTKQVPLEIVNLVNKFSQGLIWSTDFLWLIEAAKVALVTESCFKPSEGAAHLSRGREELVVGSGAVR